MKSASIEEMLNAAKQDADTAVCLRFKQNFKVISIKKVTELDKLTSRKAKMSLA